MDDGRAPGQGPVAREESPSQMPKSASFLGPQAMSAHAEGYDVYTRGQVGDNIFHLCMLLNTKTTRKMAKYLVRSPTARASGSLPRRCAARFES